MVFAGASPTRHGLEDLDLFASTGVLDKVTDVHDALVAGVGALETRVVRLYGVVVILSDFLPCAWRCGAGRREKAKLGCV